MKIFVSFCLSVLSITLSSSVYAELHGRLPATLNGTDYQAYYDDVLDITWVTDAKLAANNTFGLFYNYDLGRHPNETNRRTVSDPRIIKSNGSMDFGAALHWIDAMNATDGIGYLGINNWRLPRITGLYNDSCNPSGDNCGYYVNTDHSEIAHLWYKTLGNVGFGDAAGNGPLPNWGLTNSGPFENINLGYYWSESEPPTVDFGGGWRFLMLSGEQDNSAWNIPYYIWPVRDGDIQDIAQHDQICDMSLVGIRGNCAGTYRAYTAEDIERFANNGFGKAIDELGRVTYNNLLIAGNIGEPNTSLEIHSPCRVTVEKNSILVGSDINLHSRMGVVTKWPATIEAKNQACLISDERGVFIKGGNTISAGALAVKGKTSAILGRRSHVNVLGPIELVSTGTGQTSKAKVGIGTSINADSFTASADSKTELSYQASISTTDILSIKSRSVDGETILNAESHLLSEGDIEIGSAGITDIRANSVLAASQNIDISAQTKGHCTLAETVSLTSSSVTGICIASIP